MYAPDSPTLETPLGISHVPCAQVEPGLFEMLGARPMLGRAFRKADATAYATPVVLLSERFVRTAFGPNTNPLGTSVTLDGRPHLVVGVMPDTFRFPLVRAEARGDPVMWRPLTTGGMRRYPAWSVVGRLRHGVSTAAARLDLDAIARRSGSRDVAVLRSVDHLAVQNLASPLLVLETLALFLLLMSQLNGVTATVSALNAREADLATRWALGASPGRLFRDAWLAHVGRGCLALCIGLAVAIGLSSIFSAEGAGVLPPFTQVHVTGAAGCVAALVVLALLLAFAIAPGLYAARTGPRTRLSSAGTGWRGRSGAPRRGYLLIASLQLAMCVCLIVGVGLLLGTYRRLATTDRGFDAANVAMAEVFLDGEGYSLDRLRNVAHSLTRLGDTLPGVEQVAVGTGAPLALDRVVDISAGAAGELWISDAHVGAVTEDYFSLLRIPVLRQFTSGRAWASEGGVAVNETLWRQLANRARPVAPTLTIDGHDYRISQVVGSTRDSARALAPSAQVYLPYDGAPSSLLRVLVRFRPGEQQNPERIREAIRVVLGRVPVDRVSSVSGFLMRVIARERFMSIAGTIIGATAAVVAAFGLYGIFTHLVLSRRRDTAVRIAMGASPRQVAFRTIRTAIAVMFAGVVPGVVAATWMASVVSAIFFEVRAADVAVVLSAVAGVAVIAALALVGPIRRETGAEVCELLRDSDCR